MWPRDYGTELARIERKLDVILQHLGIEDPTTAGVSPEVIGLAQQGRKIDAIKRHRELTGLGLKEAKEAIDAIS